MLRIAIVALCAALIILKFFIPGLTTDAVWSVSQTFAFLRGSYFADTASGFFVPSLGSGILAIWFKIWGVTEGSLKCWYLVLRLLAFGFILKKLIRDGASFYAAIVLACILVFDPLHASDRTECAALLMLVAGTFWAGHLVIRNYILSILLWLIHPIAGCYHLLVHIKTPKKWLMLLVPLLLYAMISLDTLGIWLQTIFIRLQPDAMVEQLKSLKWLLPLQFLGGMILYRAGRWRAYMKQFLLLFPLLFLAGKPYYMFWLQVLMVFELGKIELSSDRWIRFSGLALALLWVYLTVIFPFAETRILNPEYPENYNQGLTLRKQMKVPTFCTPALAVPFLSKPHPTRLVVSYGIPGKIYNSAIGSTALSSELLKGEVPYQEYFGPFLFIRYHAWLIPADTITYGLFMYGAER